MSFDPAAVDIDTLDSYAADLRGNWQSWDSFAWFDQPHDADNWCIVYVSNRDSGLLDQSNASVINGEMEGYADTDNYPDGDPDCRQESHSHWAVGYVEGWAIRVNRQDGSYTDAFRCWVALQEAMANYPILDEEDYCQREMEATRENLTTELSHVIWSGDWSCEYSDDLASDVEHWLSEYNDSALENVDDQGGYPDESEIREALYALGHVDYDDPDCVIPGGVDVERWNPDTRCWDFHSHHMTYGSANDAIPADQPRDDWRIQYSAITGRIV